MSARKIILKRKQAEAEEAKPLEADLQSCANETFVPWAQISAALKTNEAKVVAAWKGSCAKISGEVQSIGSGLGDVPYVVVGTGEAFSLQNLHCRPKDPAAALELSKGEAITVWGVGEGEIMGSLVLEHCQW